MKLKATYTPRKWSEEDGIQPEEPKAETVTIIQISQKALTTALFIRSDNTLGEGILKCFSDVKEMA